MNRQLLWTVGICSSVAFGACGESNNQNPNVDAGADTGTRDSSILDAATDSGSDSSVAVTAIRVIHLSPAPTPAVDVYANGGNTAAITGLAYPNSQAYLNLPAATYSFQVRPAGAAANTAPALNVENLALAANKSYSAVAYGIVGNATTPLAALALEDNRAAPATGKIRVRAVHTAAGVGEVDIWNIPSSGSPAAIVSDLGYGEASDTLELDAGAYRLGLDANNDQVPDYTFQLPALPAGTIANVFAVLDEAPALVAVFDDGTSARIEAEAQVRVIHLSPDTGAVKVWPAGGATAITPSLEWSQTSEYVRVTGGTFNLAVTGGAATTSANPITTIDGLRIKGGTNISVAALGYAMGERPSGQGLRFVAFEDDLTAPASGAARFRAIHGVAELGPVNLILNGQRSATSIAYPAAGAYGPAPVGSSLVVGIDTDDSGDESDFNCSLPNGAPADTVLNIFATLRNQDVSLIIQPQSGATLRVVCSNTRS